MTAEALIPNVAAPLYELSAEQIELRDQAGKYFMATLHPLNQRMDDEEWWPAEAFRAIGEMGYLGQTIPEEYGGAGLDYLTSGLLAEQMAVANGAMALSVVAHDNLCANNIYRNGSEEQRRKFLPDLCSGKALGALGLTEPGAGSDALGSMATTARRDGDHYVLNGRKLFITNGPEADTLLVYAKTDKEKGAYGISAFIVEKDFPGFGVAQKLDKMGYRGSPTGELVLEDCRVPAGNLVGGENRGVAVVTPRPASSSASRSPASR
jgi:isovaleryl-CoA dehydrogenase